MVVLLCLSASAVSCQGTELKRPDDVGSPGDILLITGTIRHSLLEGGFYGIIGDDGKKYDPVNLDSQFAIDGLRVKVRARVMSGTATVHMWGKIIEIIEINRL